MKKDKQEKGTRISEQVGDPAVPNRARTEMKQENTAKNKKNDEKTQG